MSLLNDMLRDLSHQQKAQQLLTAAGDEPSYTSASVVNSDDWQNFQNTPMVKTSHQLKWVVVAVCSLLVFMVLFVTLITIKHNVTKVNALAGTPTNEPVSVVTENNQAHVALSPSQLPTLSHDVPEPHNLPESVEAAPALTQDSQSLVDAEGVQLKIYNLLEAATRAFAVDRLTTPVEDNAYSYYQQILALDSANPVAQRGLENIADRYLAMAELKLQNADVQRAEILIQRAQQVFPGHEKIAIYLDRLLQMKAVQTSARNADVENIADLTTSDNTVFRDKLAVDNDTMAEPLIVAQVEPALAESEVESHLDSGVSQSAASVSIQEPFADAEEQHLSVAPNVHWQEQQIAQQAQSLINSNQTATAITLLRNYIETSERPVITTPLLLDIYAQQSSVQLMESLLMKATYLTSVERTYYSAKLTLLKSQDGEAIQILEQHLNEAENYEPYRSLLAGLYQSTGRYTEAVNHYRRLINTFGNKPAYWLGFALSLDALNQNASALQAYQRLSDFPNLQEEVRQYIDQRIKKLTP